MVEIDRENIANVVRPLFDGIESNVYVRQGLVNNALRPIIEAYAPIADRNQKVGKEVRNHAREIIAEMGFRPCGVWYRKAKDDYQGRI